MLGSEDAVSGAIKDLNVEQIQRIAERANSSLADMEETLSDLREDVVAYTRGKVKDTGTLLIVNAMIDCLVDIMERTPGWSGDPAILDSVYQLFWNSELRHSVLNSVKEVLGDEVGTPVSEEPDGGATAE